MVGCTHCRAHAPPDMSRCPAALFLAIGSPFLPPQGSAWAVIFIWAVAGTSGYLAEKARPEPMHACMHAAIRNQVMEDVDAKQQPGETVA